MDDADRARTTMLVRDLADGTSHAARDLFPVVYDRLHRLAQTFFAGQTGSATLQPTALIHEAFLKLVDHETLGAEDRTHFVRIAARAMRQVLIDHARANRTQKRGGAWSRVTLAGVAADVAPDSLDLLALDEALDHLGAVDERQASVVELRFFGGLTVDEVATALGVSARTVELDWRMAKAWLNRALGSDDA